MFKSGFAESSEPLEFPSSQPDNESLAADTEQDYLELRQYEDSDMEDEDENPDNGEGIERDCLPEVETCNLETSADNGKDIIAPVAVTVEEPMDEELRSETPVLVVPEDSVNNSANQSDIEENIQRNVRAKVEHPSSPRHSGGDLGASARSDTNLPSSKAHENKGPKRVKVVVKDVAYSTYRAVLYYVSTLQPSFCSRDTRNR